MRTKPEVTFARMLENLHSHEGRCQAKILQVALAKGEEGQEMLAKKLELQLAELWRSYLASLLLLWHGGRTESLRRCVVNWDIYRVADENGEDQILMDPVQDKTGFRRSSEEQKKDVPKVLHHKAKSVYEAYLRQHLPVLRKNLGPAARFEPKFNDAEHGPGALLRNLQHSIHRLF